MDSINELIQFLNIDTRADVKTVALQYILGLSGSVDGVDSILHCEGLLTKLALLLDDVTIIKKDALLCLVNISAENNGVEKLFQLESQKLNFKKSGEISFISRLVQIFLDPKDKDADVACMLICNISRLETHLDECVKILYPHLSRIMEAFTDLSYNKAEAKLHYTGPLLSNLSGNREVRNWLCNNDLSENGAAKVASLCRFEGSVVRRGGAVGTIRNLCFDADFHDRLMGPEVDIVTYLLYPLAGGEEFSDDEMLSLPSSLQFLPPDKQREVDPDIRIMLLESLNKLCMKRFGREFLRKNGAYYILRELHKWEKDRKVLLVCENVVDILIKKEEEINVEDISEVNVPEEYNEKFAKMDDDFINDT